MGNLSVVDDTKSLEMRIAGQTLLQNFDVKRINGKLDPEYE